MNSVSSAGARRSRLGWKVAAVAALVMALSIPAVSAQASPAALTVTPITWNVIGLDSNRVTDGPQRFPVAVRVCNTGTTTATNVSTTFTFDPAHPNAYISLISPATIAMPDVLPGAANCRDAYYELNITRDANAQNTTAPYWVTANATGTSATTPTPRELYVEKLVSQGRNNVDAITGAGGVGDPAPTTVYLGQSYTYKMFSNTSTTYPQLETFLNFTSGIFRIDSVTQTYDNPGGTSTSVYEDACGYQSNPSGANYRKCVGPENIPGGKVGGNFVTTYQVTVVGTGTTTVAGTIYDFSGSSYHYNSDFGTGVNSVTITASYPPADLSMAASAAPNPVTVGSNVTDTFTVTNGSSANAAQSVVFTDAVPAGATYVSATPSQGACSISAGTITCNLGNMPANGSVTVAVVLTPTTAGTLSNPASVTATSPDPNSANNTATATSTVNNPPSADLSMSASAAPNPVLVGSNRTDTFTISNGSSANPAQSVVFTDAVPVGASYVSATPSQGSCSITAGTVTCNLGSIPANGSASVAVVLTANSAGTLSNPASVSSSTADPNNGNNTATASGQVNNPPSADLSMTASASPDPVVLGNNVTDTFTISNGSSSNPAQSVVFTDTVPAGATYVSATPSQGSCSISAGTITCNLGSIPAGGSATVAVVLTPTSSGTLSNQASVSSSTADPNPGNNSATASGQVNDPPPPPASADLSMTASASPDPGTTGSNVTDTFTITNGSASNASNSVSFTDTLPAGVAYVGAVPSQGSCLLVTGIVTCDLGNLPAGGNASVAVTVTPSSAGTLSNQASVTASTSDPDSSNNQATASSQVNDPAAPGGGGGGTGAPDLVVTEVASPSPANISQPLTFTFTVTNIGTAGATGVTLSDVLPPGMQFVSATPSQGSCSQSAGTVSCDLGGLVPGAHLTVVVVVIPWATGPVTDGASAGSNETDANPVDNSAVQGVRVGATCTIVGTNAPDVIYGTPGNDVICGLWGRDHIYGLGGDDVIFGDWNSDWVYGGDGNDMLWGKAGRDHLFGEAGNDVLKGGYNNDVMDSRDDVSGNDTMDGGKGHNVFMGDPGDRQMNSSDN